MSPISSASLLPPVTPIALFIAFAPSAAFAAVSNVGEAISFWVGPVTYLIGILFSVAVLVFFWGIVLFIGHAGDEEAVQKGKGFILWGMIGIFVLVSIWGIVGYFQTSLGLDTGGNLVGAPLNPLGIPVL